MRVLGVQLNIAWEDKARNCRRVAELLAPFRGEPVDLIVLPEMFATGFSMNTPQIAESATGPTTAFLSGLARDYGTHVLAGVATAAAEGRARNDAILFAPDGRERGRYSKRHPFSYGREPAHYDAGDGMLAAAIGPWKSCPLICYDLRFPEDFRAGVSRGVDLFVVIANWPAPRTQHWRALLTARAVENQAVVVGVNRCGRDPRLSYEGSSLVVDSQGQVLADAGSTEGVLDAALDHDAVVRCRDRFPALRDIRTDTPTWTVCA